MASNTSASIAKTATNTAAKVTSSLKNIAGDKATLMIVIAVTVLLFVFVIIYITMAMKSNNLQGKLLNSSPLDLTKQERLVVVKSAEIPSTLSGREYTYSLWLYMENISNTTATNHNIIMYRGSTTDASTANPIMFMNANSNKMYIAIRTVGENNSFTNLDNLIQNNWFISSNKNLTYKTANTYIIIPIDYVPLQRWVNVIFVIDNKLISLYLDGELYSVKSCDEFKGSDNNTIGFVSTNVVVDKTDGDVIIGKNNSVNLSTTMDGYIGKLEFFNYALNQNEVRSIYQNGPISKSWLSLLGITQYGVRSPVYKLNQA